MKKVMLAMVVALGLSAQVKYEDIVKGPGRDWLTYAGDYQALGLSSLDQVTPENASNMTAKWSYTVPGASGLRTRPIVHDGVMYFTNSNEVYALDARSGRLIWKYTDLKAQKKDAANRGAAILGDKVYFSTVDVHLVALDRRTGGLIWRKQYGDIKKGEFASSAPLAINGMIIVGNGGGDVGMRGAVTAMDAETGEQKWKTYTVPAKGEKGSETWGEYVEWGGGATWLSGTFDPALNTLYWTTGNPWPDFYDGDRKGDNLYSCSLLALDATTGKMKWYFQFTPQDTHDWDAQSWPVLVDLPYEGKIRKLVFHANRNGYLYVLDRVTGEYLKASKLIDKLDWSTGIDAKGKPIKVAGKDPTPNGNRVCPGVRGATNWMSQSYNPATGLLAVVTLEQCDVFTSSEQKPEPMKNFAAGGAGPKPKDAGQFFLRAFDPLTGKKVWEYPMTGKGNMWAGAVGTKTGVIFVGDDDGHLVAVDGKTGRHLWHYQTGDDVYASPIVYSAEGKQYVAIASSKTIFSFGLFEPVKSVPVPAIKIQ